MAKAGLRGSVVEVDSTAVEGDSVTAVVGAMEVVEAMAVVAEDSGGDADSAEHPNSKA
jgi:hypothetical protein